MSKSGNEPPEQRRYPEAYERIIPILLGIIAVAVVIALLVAVAVALRLLPGAGY